MSARPPIVVLLAFLPAFLSFLLEGCPYDFVLGDDAASDSGPELGKAGSRCREYGDCQSGDCAAGICVARAGWTCKAYANCSWDGGSCLANVTSCNSYLDCCSHDCGLGACLEPNPAWLLPDAGSPGCALGGSCISGADCCSQNCYGGKCAAAPANELCAFGTPCSSFSDCCSFECKAGLCADTTAPND